VLFTRSVRILAEKIPFYAAKCVLKHLKNHPFESLRVRIQTGSILAEVGWKSKRKNQVQNKKVKNAYNHVLKVKSRRNPATISTFSDRHGSAAGKFKLNL
jgi:hypothetical protein